MDELIAERLSADPTIQRLLFDLGYGGRQPRYRYFEVGQRKFAWTTERFADGKFASFIYEPQGRGARDKRKGWLAERWVVRQELRHGTRKAAKARALRLWQKENAK